MCMLMSCFTYSKIMHLLVCLLIGDSEDIEIYIAKLSVGIQEKCKDKISNGLIFGFLFFN